jgi:hypothetical protein
MLQARINLKRAFTTQKEPPSLNSPDLAILPASIRTQQYIEAFSSLFPEQRKRSITLMENATASGGRTQETLELLKNLK